MGVDVDGGEIRVGDGVSTSHPKTPGRTSNTHSGHIKAEESGRYRLCVLISSMLPGQHWPNKLATAGQRSDASTRPVSQ